MPETILTTKLYIPPLQPKTVLRSRLMERMDEGIHRKLTLISAPAGFGKTTLATEWLAECDRPAAWFSIDKADNDFKGFFTYFVAALQTIKVDTGEGVLGLLQSQPPPSPESILTTLINEIAAIPENFILILDDYHVIDDGPIDAALIFLIDHMPPGMHLVIITREDPQFPLARLRTRGQLTEVRAADLRFNSSEAGGFFNGMMDLGLSGEEIGLLGNRTEGWIAGLKLAAISMQGHEDTAGFIRSFTGSHHFVMDYLVEEVLHQQPDSVQTFLLYTSILNRLCGPLCDAVWPGNSLSGRETLEYLIQSNLFIVPLDNERQWYRYHHLFADLLRQRLNLKTASSADGDRISPAELHVRASQWYEENGLKLEAFHHAAAAHDIDRASRLVQGRGIPLHVRGGLVPVLNWLESLPEEELNERPILWVMHAGALTTSGQTPDVEEKLQAAEAAIEGAELNDGTRDLIGRIANNRATLYITRYQLEEGIEQAHRALEYLHPENLPLRSMTSWVLGAAYEFKGDRSAAFRAFTEAISSSKAIGHNFVTKLGTIGLGSIQELGNMLHEAASTFQSALEMFGEHPLPIACHAHLGLARIHYQWNDMDVAEHHGKVSVQLARQFADIIDRFVISEVFLVRLMIARGNVTGAAELLAKTEQVVKQRKFVRRLPEVAAARVLILIQQGNLAEAARLADENNIPESQARVSMADGDPSRALDLLEPLYRQVEEKGWADQRLKIMILQSVALYMHGKKEKAIKILSDSIELSEPEGFIRIYLDEGILMLELLTEAARQGIGKDYITKLLAEFELEGKQTNKKAIPLNQPLIEPLSDRELEVLELISQGLSNSEICRKLHLKLPTVKGHNRNIYGKLQVQRRTEAVARARELGLLQAD